METRDEDLDPIEEQDVDEDCDPETGTKPASPQAIKAFNQRIDDDIAEIVSNANVEEARDTARKRVIVQPVPFFSPRKVLVAYCTGVAIATFVIVGIGSWVLTWLANGVFDIALGNGVPITMGVIASVLSPLIFIAMKFSMLFKTVGAGQVGVLKYFDAIISTGKDESENMTPLPPGPVLAPDPFYELVTYPVDKRTVKFEKHTIIVQNPVEECEPLADAADNNDSGEIKPNPQNQGSTVILGGSFTIAPGREDIRDLILCFEETDNGLHGAGEELEEALARAMQMFCSGTQGPHNQREAIAIGDKALKVLGAMTIAQQANSGIYIISMAPDIKPPQEQLTAIEEANTEDAQMTRDKKNAAAAARVRAIAMTGNPDMSDEEVGAVLKANPIDPNLAAVLAAKSAKFLDPNDDSVRVIISNDEVMGTVNKIIEGVKNK